ncbi:MAG: efflux RND transporter periplasmic adaptor subunit [Albidovulum sp.]|uniref:efflux RND transporter periplasmic adaptor subunit n=1 Tax=Albidovulum sp. TaxID=1872424 RepID=UPI003CAF26BB
MTRRIKSHKIVAIIVLIAAAAWVGTGKFASVGSEEAHAAEPAPDNPTESADTATAETSSLRTVAAVVPTFIDHAREIRISGVTGADKRAVLAARSSGIISSLTISQGDVIAADVTVMAVEGADVAAAVMTAQATLAQREQELEVAEKLFKTGNTAELQLIKVRAEKAAAEAGLSQAEAAVDRLSLRAPFAGVVDKVEVELGEWVQSGTPIATMLSLDPIVVRAEVSELDVGYVEVEDRASVRLVNGTTLQGTVRHIAREASEETRTYPVEVTLPNPDGAVPAGMTAEVSLFTQPERAVIVPRSVITLSSEGELGLRIVGQDDVAGFASVELIDDTPEGLVLTGVPEDARIIVLGQDLVRDGEKVSVKDAATIPTGE